MKPPPFEYYDPASLEEAAQLRAELGPDATILAGGQSLVPMLNMRLARPSALIDLNRIPELAYVRREDGGIAVGAMTRHRELELSEEAYAANPLLRDALRHVAHTIVRNRGTIGGSIAHADPAAELPAVLVALGGRVVATGRSGEPHDPGRGALRVPLHDRAQAGRDPDRGLVPSSACRERARVPRDQPPARRLRAGRGRLRRHRRQGSSRLHRASGRARCSSRATTRRRPPTQPSRRATSTATADYRRELVRVLTRPSGRAGRAREPRLRPDEDGAPSASTAATTSARSSRGFCSPTSCATSSVSRALTSAASTACAAAARCTFDGAAVRSCLLFAVQVDGARDPDTIEGAFHDHGELHPIQAGVPRVPRPPVRLLHARLRDGDPRVPRGEPAADLTEDEVREAISGNLCRCTGYQNIVEAVKLAARTMHGGAR